MLILYHMFDFYQVFYVHPQLFLLWAKSIWENWHVLMVKHSLLGHIFLAQHLQGLMCHFLMFVLFWIQMYIFLIFYILVSLVAYIKDLDFDRNYLLEILALFQFLEQDIFVFYLNQLLLGHLKIMHFHRNRIWVYLLRF